MQAVAMQSVPLDDMAGRLALLYCAFAIFSLSAQTEASTRRMPTQSAAKQWALDIVFVLSTVRRMSALMEKPATP
jgi:hypothetical protein